MFYQNEKSMSKTIVFRSVFTQSYDTSSDSIPPDESGSPDITTFSGKLLKNKVMNRFD